MTESIQISWAVTGSSSSLLTLTEPLSPSGGQVELLCHAYKLNVKQATALRDGLIAAIPRLMAAEATAHPAQKQEVVL